MDPVDHVPQQIETFLVISNERNLSSVDHTFKCTKEIIIKKVIIKKSQIQKDHKKKLSQI